MDNLEEDLKYLDNEELIEVIGSLESLNGILDVVEEGIIEKENDNNDSNE